MDSRASLPSCAPSACDPSATGLGRRLLRIRLSSGFHRYSVAIALMAGAIAITAVLNEATPRAPGAVVFATALVIAWIAGVGPALVASGIASIALVHLRQADGLVRLDGREALWAVEFLATVTTMVWLTTRVRDLQHERVELVAREREARAQAEAASAAKDAFLAMVSHEMRTPLTVILGWVEMLRRTETSPADRARAVETIARNASLQSALINDLLDSARIEAGKLDIAMDMIDAADLVQHVVRSHEPRSREARIALSCVIEADVFVLGDRGRLEQVVGNLLTNALKFTPAGGRVRVSLARWGAMARIVVADSGSGIDPTHLHRIFDRFWQEARVGRPGGLGLGLAIVRSIVEAHGGRVWAESAGPGKGATLTVELPRRAGRQARAHQRPEGSVNAPERRESA